ncbi:MAG TPA: glycosyltransferase [Gaiellaceae bacterium]
MLLDTLAAGGAERLAVDLACGVDRSAYHPHVLATKRGGPLEDRLERAGVTYTILGRRRRTSARPAIRALAFGRSTDLIHSHLFGNNVWGALLARAAGVPLLVHEHNRVGPHTRFDSLLDRQLIGGVAHRILCVSDSVARPFVDIGLAPEQIQIVPNGVRLDAALPFVAARRELGLPASATVVGSVASLRPEKGHDVLLHAFAGLLRQPAAPSDLLLCLVGDGSERARLEGLARSLDLAERVLFAGERPDAARLAGAFDVAVVASHSEGLPLAVLEAMAAGAPLVATRVGALPELLGGGAGLLVPPADHVALCRAVGLLLAERVLASELAGRARKRVSERHDLQATVVQIERAYDAALTASPRRKSSRRKVHPDE